MGAGEEQQRALRLVFGDSSDSDADEDQLHLRPVGTRRWVQNMDVPGLWFCPNFLTSDRQSWLLSSIQSEGWFADATHNQAMRFGELPNWAVELSTTIRDAASCNDVWLPECTNQIEDETFPPSPSLLWREPIFDQLIVNVYHPGEGICSHVDLLRFDDGIAIVSLESSCVMNFTRATVENSGIEIGERERRMLPLTEKVPILLVPGSLVLLSGEARYLWKHEINRNPGFQVWEGVDIEQERRTSITLRKLCPPT